MKLLKSEIIVPKEMNKINKINNLCDFKFLVLGNSVVGEVC